MLRIRIGFNTDTGADPASRLNADPDPGAFAVTKVKEKKFFVKVKGHQTNPRSSVGTKAFLNCLNWAGKFTQQLSRRVWYVFYVIKTVLEAQGKANSNSNFDTALFPILLYKAGLFVKSISLLLDLDPQHWLTRQRDRWY